MRRPLTEIGYRQYHRVAGNPLWKGVFVIGGGTALAQAIGILAMPLLTRLFTPTNFGLLGLFVSTLSILTVLASLRYEQAIPIPRDTARAASILVLCVAILLGISAIISITIVLFGSDLASLLDLKELLPYAWLIVIGFLGSGTYQALNYWAIRHQDYTCITKTKIAQSVGGAVSKVTLGLLSLGPVGLIVGNVISNIAGTYTFISVLVRNDRDAFRGLSITDLHVAAREYWTFPVYTLPASVLVAVTGQIPVFMLTSIYGFTVVGWYTLAHQMLGLPVGLVAGSMAQVFYGEAALHARENPDRLKRLYLDTTKKLAVIAIPLIGIPTLLSPWVFSWVFGEVWRNAGLYCLPLSLVAISQFIVMPTSRLAVYGFNHWDFYFNVARIALVIAGFLVVGQLGLSPLVALAVYGIITAFTYGILLGLNVYAIGCLRSKART